jgi:hypothetical protein
MLKGEAYDDDDSLFNPLTTVCKYFYIDDNLEKSESSILMCYENSPREPFF